jgi:hypothetical protein
MKTVSYTNDCAGNVDESQGTYQRAAVLKTSNSSRRKRKAGKNKNIYINERSLKRAHNNSMFSLITQIH